MIRLSVVLLIVIGATIGYGQRKPTEADEDVIRVNTTLVTVPVSVSDRDGRFVANLKQSQFHLYENGIEQKIAFFETAGAPFTVALMLDTSDSTRFKLEDIQAAARAFIDELRPEDRVLIAAFDSRVVVLTEPTSDRRKLYESIERTQTGGGTALYSAMETIASQRFNQIRGRKAIVLFTDGVDTSSVSATFQGTLRAAEELDALIYPIQFNTYDDYQRSRPG